LEGKGKNASLKIAKRKTKMLVAQIHLIGSAFSERNFLLNQNCNPIAMGIKIIVFAIK